jgi:hypothetical protein
MQIQGQREHVRICCELVIVDAGLVYTVQETEDVNLGMEFEDIVSRGSASRKPWIRERSTEAIVVGHLNSSTWFI